MDATMPQTASHNLTQLATIPFSMCIVGPPTTRIQFIVSGPAHRQIALPFEPDNTDIFHQICFMRMLTVARMLLSIVFSISVSGAESAIETEGFESIFDGKSLAGWET